MHERWYGWDGAADSLWAQAIRPILHAHEMDANPPHVRDTIARDSRAGLPLPQGLRPGARRTTPKPCWSARARRSALSSARWCRAARAFDAFRDALARGDAQSAALYPAPAQRGLRLFVGRGSCHLCHVGPLFTNGEFGDTGLPFFVRPGVVDPGRQRGIELLQLSEYNLLSRWSDARDDAAVAMKTRQVVPQHRNFGEFKVPSLRNVALTAPYAHDGQLATLDDVVRHYSELNLERLHADGEQILKPLRLSDGERADLVAFSANAERPVGDEVAAQAAARMQAAEARAQRTRRAGQFKP